MKKLMTMIGAAAVAFGLYAADPDNLSGTSFEGTTGGALSNLVGIVELNQQNGGWAFAGEANVVSYLGQSMSKYTGVRPSQFADGDNDYFLSLKTGSEELTRYALGDAATYAVTEANGNYYFDSVVKLTGFDETPDLTETGAKLAIWLSAIDTDATATPAEPGQTNLYVSVNGTTYNCGPRSDLLDAWARVTIKALPIKTDMMGFVVFIDQTPLSGFDCEEPGLNPVAQAYANKGQLLVCDDAATIASVSFKGQGSVDDIVFTQTLPFDNAADPQVFELTVGSGITGFTATYGDQIVNWTTDAAKPSFVYDEKLEQQKVVLSAVTFDDPNKFLKSVEIPVTGSDITIPDAVVAVAKIGTDLYDDLNEAVAAAAGQTLTLLANATNLAISASMTLDLNSFTITPVEDADALDVNYGDLIVNDTGDNGKIDGVVFVSDGDATAKFYGGKILAEGNDKTTLDNYAKDDYEFTEKDGYFVLTEKAKTFAVTAAAAAANTKLTVQTNGVDLTGVNDVYTANIGDTIVVTYTADEGYEFADGAKTTDEFTTNDSETFATAPVATIKTFTVTYMVDGVKDSEETVNWGEKPVKVPSPDARTGYKGAWDKNPDGVIKANETFTYTYTAETYTITYWNGGNQLQDLAPSNYTVAAAATLPNEVALLGVSFQGWFVNSDFTGEAVTVIPAGSTGNTNFYAKVVQIVEQDPTVEKPEDIPESDTAGDRYGNKVPTALAGVSARAIATWAQGNGNLEKGETIIENAFLLNCANTEEAVNAEKANFKATSITVNSDGSVTVGTPEGYNGEIKKLGKAELSDPAWSEDLTGKKFFELKLVPANLN